MELTISTEARGWKNVAEGDQRSSGLPLPTQVQSAWTLGIWLLLSRFQRTGMLGRVVSLGSQSREPQDPSGEPRHGRSHHREPLRGHLTEPLGGHCHSSGPGKQSLEPRGLFSRFKIQWDFSCQALDFIRTCHSFLLPYFSILKQEYLPYVCPTIVF